MITCVAEENSLFWTPEGKVLNSVQSVCSCRFSSESARKMFLIPCLELGAYFSPPPHSDICWLVLPNYVRVLQFLATFHKKMDNIFPLRLVYCSYTNSISVKSSIFAVSSFVTCIVLFFWGGGGNVLYVSVHYFTSYLWWTIILCKFLNFLQP